VDVDSITLADGSYLDWSVPGQLEAGNADGDAVIVDMDEDGLEAEQIWAAAGHDITPGHDRLHRWWVYGPGRARWKTWTELLANLVEEVHDKPLPTLKKWASRWFFERYHFYSGDDRNRVMNGKPPRGSKVGPG
jgi:hypothetical protein